MERENCYNCGQQGHWSWYCPLPLKSNNNNHSTVSPKLIHCRCGHGFCHVNISRSEKEYFVCPIKRGVRCTDFVKWYNDPINESDLHPPLLKYPQCECGAGVCRRLEEKTTESPNGVKYYFVCPINLGQGSCGYRVLEEELLNNTSEVVHKFYEGCQNDTTDHHNDLGKGSDLANIKNDFFKSEALLEASNQRRNLLCEQVSHLKIMLHEKQNELTSCESETMKIEAQLGDITL